ncbi:MAG: HAD family hydrolase [Nannocystaceae bacterium]
MGEAIAVLDVDGTLLPGSLGLALLRELAERRVIAPGRIDALFAVIGRQRAGLMNYAEMVESTTSLYAEALRGVDPARVDAAADEVWSRHRGGLFDFVPAMIERLRRAGWSPVIVSSSPREVIARIAAELGIDLAIGSVFPAPEGVHDGTCALMPGRPGGKVAALRGAFEAQGRSVDLAGSFALGNAPSDVSVLEVVGAPIAFEPVPELRRIAEARGWRIRDRETLLTDIDEWP